MPPASLSTLAVMIPGPITAATAAIRAQRERSMPGRRDSAMQDFFQHVVDGDDAEQLPLPLHRKREEVVLGGELRDLARRIVRRERRRVLMYELLHRRPRRGQEQIAQREHAQELLVGPHHEA